MLGKCIAVSENGRPRLTALCYFSVPLCFVYPAMLHYKACAHTWRQKAADIALGIFGTAAAIYTTFQTIIVSVVTSFSEGDNIILPLTAHGTTGGTCFTYWEL